MSSHEIDTIVLGVPCTIQYDYQPYEAPERGPEAQYPGCPESVYIVDVLVGDISVWDWFDGDDNMMECLEDVVYEYRINQCKQALEDKAESRQSDWEDGWMD